MKKKDIPHFKDFQEYYMFLNATPVEPKEHKPAPKKKRGKKEDGTVLQAD